MIPPSRMTRQPQKNVKRRQRSGSHKKAALDNPEQSKRFIDMAHEVEVDESRESFDKAFDRVDIKAPKR